jgi:hypothetical protein
VTGPELSFEGADADDGGDAGMAATAAAWGAAAALFGAVPPVRPLGDGWVDADPATGEALHPPEYAVRGDPGAGASDAPFPAQGPGRSHEPVDTPASDGGGSGGSDAGSTGPGASAERKPEGQQMIDRLVARLREEGMGAEAARLVTVYGGYGRDAAAQRELYAKLRALLVERSART